MSWVFGPGGGGTPGGADQDIQFNNNGSFSGSNLLTTDGSGSLSASTHVSASTYYGDGSNLTGVTASAVQVADGPEFSLQFRFDSPVSGELSGSADLTWNTGSNDLLVTGNVRLQEDYEFYGDIEGAVRFPARAAEVGGITKGQVVYINGISGQTPTVALAACDDPSKMPAFGLAAETAASGSDIQIVTFGSLKGLNFSTLYGKTFSVGDTVFVETGSSGTSGSLTNVAPTGSGNLLQNLGKIVRNGGGGDGQIKVGGAGRTNATPNLDKGHIFVGNETDQAIQDSTIFVSASAERVGINVSTNLSAALHVSASSVLGGESARFEGLVVITSPDGELVVQDTTNNKQIRMTANALPTMEFGDSTDTDDFFFIQGGATSKIQVDPGLTAFIIATSSAGTGGFVYKPAQERVGIHTPSPSHDFTVNGDTYVTGAISASIGVSSSQVEAGNAFVTDAYVSSVPADRVLVSTTNGQITSHSPFTFASDVLSVPTITASVGISSSILILDPTSGSLAGDGSYLGLNANNQIIVTSSAGGGTPGGADTQIQFNDGGSFGGDSTLTFNKTTDVLSVSTITASVGIETTSSANGSINIGEGIRYTFSGSDRLDAFENEFKLRDINYYKAISTVQTSNFNIEGFQTFLVNTSGSVVTGTLPGLTSDDQIGLTYTIKDFAGSGSTNNVVVAPSGSQEIDSGTAAKIQTNFGALTLTALSSSHGYTWGIVSAT